MFLLLCYVRDSAAGKAAVHLERALQFQTVVVAMFTRTRVRVVTDSAVWASFHESA